MKTRLFTTLPTSAQAMVDWPWEKLEPYFAELQQRPLRADNVHDWLTDWTHLAELLSEVYARLYVATTVDTNDEQAEQRYKTFLDEILPRMEAAEQQLKVKLLDSGLQPEGFAIPLRNIRQAVELFREENLPLISEELKLSTEYDKIVGAQTIQWDGQEVTLPQLQPVYLEQDRGRRERAWRLAMERWLADRQAINELWQKLLDLRVRQARNAGFDDYRAYRWKQLLRFDYTPENCAEFHDAIEEVVVPAVERLYARRRERLGLESLRPWDLEVDPDGHPALKPFTQVSDLMEKTAAIFQRVDPQLGGYFATMRQEGLLDLENRKGKAPGGYCIDFGYVHRPFIFMNAVGIHDDVQTLLHEGGHAFHVFESADLPYIQQKNVTMEFAEVASMAMELLSAPYLEAKQGGFYSPAEAARARLEHLEGAIRFWPYMAVVDAFQHWAYTHAEQAADPANCDAEWDRLWGRFMRGVDWSGLEETRRTGWQRKLHIIQVPFYYVEYGLAQMGAFQVWRNARRDQAGAVAAYRRALSLGGTASLPELYAAAGARFAFDAATLKELVDLGEQTIYELEEVAKRG